METVVELRNVTEISKFRLEDVSLALERAIPWDW